METGTLLGRYRLQVEVGRGGMGQVYRAVDEELGRPVAVKILPPAITGADTFVERFRREARTIAGLSHPGIVAVYDVGQQDGVHYLVMELLEGRTLSAIMAEERPMAPERAIGLVRQIADALDYAHERGIIHRDVKPANVIVSTDGRATLTDFGIAHAAATERITVSGSIVGTPVYMAPEQALGQPVDSRADLYSLGVMLFEMLAGAVPFNADSTPAILVAHAYQAPPSPLLFRPELPAGVDTVMQRALAKAPSERFQHGAELVAAAEEALMSSPATMIVPDSPLATKPRKRAAPGTVYLPEGRDPPRGRKHRHSRRWWILAAVGAGVAAVLTVRSAIIENRREAVPKRSGDAVPTLIAAPVVAAATADPPTLVPTTAPTAAPTAAPQTPAPTAIPPTPRPTELPPPTSEPPTAVPPEPTPAPKPAPPVAQPKPVVQPPPPTATIAAPPPKPAPPATLEPKPGDDPPRRPVLATLRPIGPAPVTKPIRDGSPGPRGAP